MKNPNRKLYFKSAVTAIIAGIIFSLGLFTVYAYFSTQGKVYTADGEGSYAVFGTNLDLLFDRIDDKKVASGTDIGSGFYDSKAAWGSAQNPYVISATRHVQNLSVLQSIGYFEELFTSKGTIPHFLICNTDGTPITIDGTDVTIKPIGNSRYPFYGYVGGAFGEGTTSAGSLSSDTSALYNFTVETTEDNIDVGLFGYVGMLNENEYSALMNLLLYDVKIVVDQPTIVEQAADIVNHIFSYSNVGDVDPSTIPHENHHIGILAGHVYHTKVNNISVYYSNDDIAALDFSHTSGVTEGEAVPNYMSSTGIIGFLDHMNPDITNGSVVAGTGTSSGDISISGISGSGGGLASGTGRGYVTAAAVYEAYSKGVTDNGTGSLIIKDGVDADGNALCHEWIRNNIFGNPQNTGKYYFYDGVFTFALSEGSTDTIEDTFNMDENNKVTDTFVLGQDDDSRWKKNVAEGNYAVAAFLEQLKSSNEIKQAAIKGEPLIIMHKQENDAFLLSLNDANKSSTSIFQSNDYYKTAGSKVRFADEELKDSILTTYINDPDKSGFNQAVIDRLETDDEGNISFGNMEVLNLGISSDAGILDNLATKYNVVLSYTDDENYSYIFTDGSAAMIKNGYAYHIKEWVPFYYRTVSSNGLRRTYTYSYVDSNMTKNDIKTYEEYIWESNDPDESLTILYDEETGLPMIDLGNNGVHLYLKENTDKKVFEAVSTKENEDERDLYYTSIPDITDKPITPMGEGIEFIYYDQNTDTYYDANNNRLSAVVVQEDSITIDGQPFSGAVVIRDKKNYFTIKDTNKVNSLYLLKTTGFLRTYYSIWNGSEIPKNTEGSNRAYFNVKDNDSGSFDIRLNLNTNARFLNFYADNNAAMFSGSASSSDSTTMYVYRLLCTTDINYGHITWDPTDPLTEAENADVNTPAIEFASDEYVLWPNASAITSAGNTVSAPSYTVKKLSDLAGGLNGASSGWRNDHGEPLTAKDLYKKFHMASETRFDIAINIGKFNWATGGFLRAPIGTLGTEAYIPQGAVAFRVNKAGESKIRVIVALPQSDYSPEEEEYKLSDKDTYFGVWQVGKAGDSFLQTFDRNTAIEKFFLPKSEPYKPNSSIDECQKYTISYNGQSYRSYLNGDRILMAYEFTVDQEGVYILATDGAPMEIVYFSADGTASAGRDGSGGSVIGNIDFVYDYGGNVITVTNPGTEADGYSKYVASLCLLNTKNNTNLAETGYAFPDINEAMIKIRRYVADGESQINLKVTGNDATYIDIIRYAALADKVNRK